MTEEHDVWIRLKDHKPVRSPARFSFRPLAVILAFLVGWIALVVILRTLLPVSNAMRGALYLAYLVVATIVVGRSIKKAQSKDE